MDNGFVVSFRFDGGLANQGELDASDHATTVAAGRRLLAMNAHAFVHGRVPTAALSDGKGYHVRHVGSFKGSHDDIWRVVLESQWTVAAVTTLGTMYADDLREATNACARFFKDSVKAALGIGPDRLPEFRRIEPSLRQSEGNSAPMLDIEAEQASQRRRLLSLTSQILPDVMRPVGRSADRLYISVQNEVVATIDDAIRKSWLADQITRAVKEMRDRGEIRQHQLW